jgi:hypothetical protein
VRALREHEQRGKKQTVEPSSETMAWASSTLVASTAISRTAPSVATSASGSSRVRTTAAVSAAASAHSARISASGSDAAGHDETIRAHRPSGTRRRVPFGRPDASSQPVPPGARAYPAW